MKNPQIFTSESVSEGHPDKVCDQISDAILDSCLRQDKESRVACETMCTTDRVVVAGEITTKADIDVENIVREVVREIGYTRPGQGFDADNIVVESYLHKQSPNIAQGVDATENHEQGAGDQGMMFGYASGDALTEYMPEPIYFSHKLMKEAVHFRKNVERGRNSLQPDAKCQLSFEYNGKGSRPILKAAVISHQHLESADAEELKKVFHGMIYGNIPDVFLYGDFDYYFNPTGLFVLGGPAWDTGLTGRKIVVDTYGGMGRVGGGAFSGKDPSKVDRSAAYMCRHVAKHLVKTGMCKECEVQVAYAIGVAKPVSILVNDFGTSQTDEDLAWYVKQKFDFRPQAIVERFGLKNPKGWNYYETAQNGHFGNIKFPWEKDAE